MGRHQSATLGNRYVVPFGYKPFRIVSALTKFRSEFLEKKIKYRSLAQD